jgi:putative membrane protein
MPNRLVTRAVLAASLCLPGALAGCMGAGMQDPATAASAMGMGNEDVLGIIIAANQSEVEMGLQATQRASNPAVRAFAERMVSDHTPAEATMRAMAQRMGLPPRESETSRSLQEFTRTSLDALGARSGMSFDQEYMRLQAQQHRWLLEALERNLIPGAQNEQLRTALQRMRPTIAVHLREAERIHASLGR